MTKGELIEKIRAQLKELETREGKLSEEELAVFILWKLIEEKSFDSQYYFGTQAVREKIYKLNQQQSNHKPDKDDTAKRKLTCIGMSTEYKYIAEELGLKVSLEKMSYFDGSSNDYSFVNDLEYGQHLFNTVHCSNGRKIRIDVQGEIAKMQTRSMPQEIDFDFDKDKQLFVHRNSVHKQEENQQRKENQKRLDEILRKIGYIGESELYTDEICKRVINESQDCLEIEIVSRILEDPTIQTRLHKTKICELYRTYRRNFKYNGNFDGTVILPCYVERKFGERQYSLCIYCEDKDDCGIWIYSRNNQKMERINLETMRFFLENGLDFVTDTSGESYKLKRFIESMKKRIDESVRCEKSLMNIDDILEIE